MDHKPPLKATTIPQLGNIMEIYISTLSWCLKGMYTTDRRCCKGRMKIGEEKFIFLVIPDNFMQIGTKIFTKTPRIFLTPCREWNNSLHLYFLLTFLLLPLLPDPNSGFEANVSAIRMTTLWRGGRDRGARVEMKVMN